MELIKSIIKSSITTKSKILNDQQLLNDVELCANEIIHAFKRGNKLLLCGNGGSAADAQHIAAEFSGRFLLNRKPLPAEALHVNSSYITAVANDYGFEHVYARMVDCTGKKGDILIAISTSGSSENILNALKTAKDNGIITIGLTGENGIKISNLCDFMIKIPSAETARIQESHIMIGHILCEIVEKELFG
jgi:D-sedoheptulose 7-phosphate isomerase